MLLASPPRKRPYRMGARAQAAAATGERLLAAGWQQVASRPYDDVRLGEIAAEAGVSPQTLHNRFHSKEELFAAAFSWWGVAEATKRDTAPVGDVPGAIAVLFDRYETQGQIVLRLLSQEERIPAVRHMTDTGRAYHHHWARRTFAPLAHGLRGAARERRLQAIATATDLLVWKLLRQDMGLPRAQAERVMAEMIEPTSC
jgi:AcrR family transcriptional regulator